MYRKSCEEFISDLNSSRPVPGGGGAAALIGAIGTALGGMVMNLTAANPRLKDRQEACEALAKEAETLEQRFLLLINEDASCFEPLSAAYRLPKNTEEEKAEKDRVMQEALQKACEAPFGILTATRDALLLLQKCEALGAKLAISDVGAGAAACRAAGDAAVLNIWINAGMLKEEEKKQEYFTRAQALLSQIDTLSEEIYTKVSSRLR